MEGIREYLPEQNVMPLEKAISQVQDAHSSCANFADILVGALNKFRVKYSYKTFWILLSYFLDFNFQDAVNSMLRNHKIKPHWMFHLDSLIRNAVKQSVDILAPESSPETEANLDFLDVAPSSSVADQGGASNGVKNVSSNEGSHNLRDSPVIPNIGGSSGLDLHKSLSIVQNFVRRLAFELESRTSATPSPG